jgi:hypothetical protein
MYTIGSAHENLMELLSRNTLRTKSIALFVD